MRPAPRLCAVLLAVACHDEVRCGDTVTGDAGTEPAEFECVRAGPADHVEPPDMSVLNCAELTRCMGDCVGGDVEACRNACTTDAGPAVPAVQALRDCGDQQCADQEGAWWEICLAEHCREPYDACLADHRAAHVPCDFGKAVNDLGVGQVCLRDSDCARCGTPITCAIGIQTTNPNWCTFICGLDETMAEAHHFCGEQAYCWVRRKSGDEVGIVGSCAPLACLVEE